ncbi:MAG: hypothetical protein RRY12_01705 [Cloacibacillus sp.]
MAGFFDLVRAGPSKLRETLAYKGEGKRLNISVLAAFIAVISFAPFMMVSSFAEQDASILSMTPSEVTIFAAREASSGVTPSDAQTMRLAAAAGDDPRMWPILWRSSAGEGLTWTSDHWNVVTVNASGDITSVSPGDATISVHLSYLSAVCKVKVVPAPTTNWAASADISWHDKNKTTFTITTAQQLAGAAALVNAGSDDFKDKTIILSNDIDLSAREWTAIGMRLKPFKGTFNGGGHAITGLYINKTGDSSHQGLFGYIGRAGVVKNLRLSGCVAGGASVGGVAGDNGGAVANCAMTGSVTGTINVGGVTGDNFNGTVTNCAMTGSVTGYINVGGVAAQNRGTITNCAMAGSVTGGRVVGGVVGNNISPVPNGAVTDSVITDSVAVDAVGDKISIVPNGAVTNSVMTNSIKGNESVGGVVGNNISSVPNGAVTDSVIIDSVAVDAVGDNISIVANGTVTSSVMIGSVNGNEAVGGVVGQNGFSATVTNCGWLADAAASGVGKNDNRTASPGVASFDAANIPITTILFDDYDLKAVVNTSSDITVRTYPRASYALQTAVSQNIAKIENFAISGDATVARVTGTKTGSADVMVYAFVPHGASYYLAEVEAHITVAPEPNPDPHPWLNNPGTGCSSGAGGIAMLALAAAAMLGRKGKR